jgi:hypothetical protein
MRVSINQALAAGHRTARVADASAARLLIAGATGALGNAVLQRLVGMQRFAHTSVLATQAIAPGLRTVSAQLVQGDITDWPVAQPPAMHHNCAIVMFDPPRMFYDRERALWCPAPEQLGALATWLHANGVRTLAVVLPHAQGSLPEALKRGLANLDEQALAAISFERLLIVRSAQKPAAASNSHMLHGLAAWMLGITRMMVPSSEQPVRATKVAELVDLVLQYMPIGTWVAAPELVWQAAQGDAAHMRKVVMNWLVADRKEAV